MIFLLLILLFTQLGCDEGDPRTRTRQTDAQKIDTLNNVVAEITNPITHEEIHNTFVIFPDSRTNLHKKKIIMYGEHHVDVPSLIAKHRLLHHLVKKDDVVLFEGNQKGKEYNAFVSIPLSIITARMWNQSPKIYDPETFRQFSKLVFLHFSEVISNFSDKINFGFQRIILAKSEFWDDADELKKEVNRQTLTKRNYSLILSAQSKLAIPGTIHISSGSRHTPLGEWLHCRKVIRSLFENNPLSLKVIFNISDIGQIDNSLDDFYAAIHAADSYISQFPNAAHRNLAQQFVWDITQKHGCGSTYEIYQFLKDKDYAIAIHNRVLQ